MRASVDEAGRQVIRVRGVPGADPAASTRPQDARDRRLPPRGRLPHSRSLSPTRAETLVAELGRRGLAGGPVDDALVAATALERGARLVSRDRRALPTHRELGVELELLD